MGKWTPTAFRIMQSRLVSRIFLHIWAVSVCTGGHINPAVTLALAVVGRLKWIKVPVYFLAQYLGAFFGAACVYLVYYGLLLVLIALFSCDRLPSCSTGCLGWWCWLSGRTSVFGRRTFPVLRPDLQLTGDH